MFYPDSIPFPSFKTARLAALLPVFRPNPKTADMKTLKPKPAIRLYSAKQLAFFYLISKPTFQRWIEPYQDQVGLRNGNYYTSAQVEIIFQKLGRPS